MMNPPEDESLAQVPGELAESINEIASEDPRLNAPETTDGERRAWFAGLTARRAVQKDNALKDVIDYLEDAKRVWAPGSAERVTADRVVEQLAQLAFMPWSKSYKLRHVFAAQVKCLELIGKYLKMFVEKLEINDEKDLADRMKEALARVARIAKSRKIPQVN